MSRNINKIISLACCVSIVSLCSSYAQEVSVSPADFEKEITTRKPQLLDVRTAAEYHAGHLKNALQADWLDKEQFTDRVKYLDKTKPLLVYCGSSGRSGQAAKWLLDNGFSVVLNLKGGLTSWKLEGKAVETDGNIAQMTVGDYIRSTNEGEVVLVDFGAPWCIPCRLMEPVLEQLQTDMKDRFKLIKVDGGINTDVMKSVKIDAIPVFIIYKKGKEVWRKKGVVDIAEFKEKLSE